MNRFRPLALFLLGASNFASASASNEEDVGGNLLRGTLNGEGDMADDAQQIKSQWVCYTNGNAVAQVGIWWGHTAGAAAWACNSWNKAKCGGKCAAHEYAKACNGQDKLIRIYAFWINGDPDSGAYGEHRLDINGEVYFPRDKAACDMDGKTCYNEDGKWYVDIKQEMPTNINAQEQVDGKWQQLWVRVPAYNTLTAYTEEHDTYSNDHYTATLSPDQWYVETCDTYEVRMTVTFEPPVDVESCLELSAEVNGSVESEGKGGGAAVGAGYTQCKTWEEEAETMEWFIHVKPASFVSMNEAVE